MNIKYLMIFFGLFSGMFAMLFHLIQYSFQLNKSVTERIIFEIFPVFAFIFCIFGAIFMSKKQEFSQMLKIGVGVSLISAIITAFYFVCFRFYIASPEYIENQIQTGISQLKEIMPNLSEQQLQETISEAQNPTFKSLFVPILIKNIFLGFIISLGISALLKIIRKS